MWYPRKSVITASFLFLVVIAPLIAQRGATPAAEPADPVKTLAGRLDLERYKATIRGLAQFGDRRQGTERNRQAIDWIETQLKYDGCSNTERIKYVIPDPTATQAAGARDGGRAGGNRGAAQTGPAQRGQAARGVGGVGRQAKVIESGETIAGQGGSRYYGVSAATGVNNDANRQPDARLRELNAEQSKDGPREEVYCTSLTWTASVGVKALTTTLRALPS